MRAAASQSFADGSEPDYARQIVAEALSILKDEREVFLSGEYLRLSTILEAKSAVLEKLELAIHTAPRSVAFIADVRNLIAESRRNEQIIQAARQGLSHARRRLKAIDEMRSGVVAYAEDGSRISSRDDLLRGGRSA